MGRGTSPYASPAALSNYCTKMLWPKIFLYGIFTAGFYNPPFSITSKWCKEHFALPSVSSILCSLTIPIYIFQGEDDANIPLSDIEKIRNDFKRKDKSNLHIFTFPNHDHDLNYLQYIFSGTISDGIKKVFDIAQSF